MILEPISIATGGYIGVGPGRGDFCPTALAIATDGYVRIQPPSGSGRPSTEQEIRKQDKDRQRREERARERTRKRIERKQKQVDELVSRIMATGEAEVDGTTIDIEVPKKPKPPIALGAPKISTIKSDIDRQLAEAIREKELKIFEQRMDQFRQELIDFENAIAVVILIAME